MKANQMAKRILDVLMIVLLPILMAEILTGQELHEWLGIAITVCFIAHHILNFSWIKNLFKGKYTPVRSLITIINLLLLVDILVLTVSGIMMSSFVFPWLKIRGGMHVARQLHLFASYWGLILMSAHTGIHAGMMQKAFRRMFHIESSSALRTWILRVIAVCAAAYGVYAFVSPKIADYLFLQTHFVMFDETKSAVVFFMETIAVIVLFSVIFYYLKKLLGKFNVKKAGSIVSAIVAFAVPVLVCLAVVAGMTGGSPDILGIGVLTESA